MSKIAMIFHINLDGERVELEGLWNHHKLTGMLLSTYLEDTGYTTDSHGKAKLVQDMLATEDNKDYTVETALPLIAAAIVDSFDIRKKMDPMPLNKREKRYIEFIAFKELETAVKEHLIAQ